MRTRRKPIELESTHGIDLAPMLDFVTNLLIFFIITAVFVKESGLTVNRPTSFEQKVQKQKKSIQIQILANGQIWLDNQDIDPGSVQANVERLSAGMPGAGVLVMAQDKVPTKTLVNVIDQVHLAGIYNITFATQE